MDPKWRVFQTPLDGEAKPMRCTENVNRLTARKQGELGATEHNYENFKKMFPNKITIETKDHKEETGRSLLTTDEDGEGDYVRMGDKIFYMKPVSEIQLQEARAGPLKDKNKIKMTDGVGTDASHHGRTTPEPDYNESDKQGYNDFQKGSDYDVSSLDVFDGDIVKQGLVERQFTFLPPPRSPSPPLRRATSTGMIDNDQQHYKDIGGGEFLLRAAPNYAVHENRESTTFDGRVERPLPDVPPQRPPPPPLPRAASNEMIDDYKTIGGGDYIHAMRATPTDDVYGNANLANLYEDNRNIPAYGNNEATMLYGSMHALLDNEEDLPVYNKEYMVDLKRALMTRRKHGCFALILMDEFAQGDDPYRLIAYSNGVIVDKPILRKGNRFKLSGGGNKLFRDMKSLVEYYSKNKVPDTNCLLLHPAKMALKGKLVSTIRLGNRPESPYDLI